MPPGWQRPPHRIAHGGLQRRVQHCRRFVSLRQNPPPGIDDQRMAMAFNATVRITAALIGRDDKALIFDSPCANENLPMSPPGLIGEVGGDQQNRRPFSQVVTVQFGEAQVVADGQAAAPAFDVDQAGLVTSRIEPALAHLAAIGQRGIEEVELAVGRTLLSLSIEEQRRIEAAFPVSLDKATPQNPTVPPRRFPGEPLRDPSADGFGAVKQRFPVPAAGEDFGQHYEIGGARGGQLVRELGQIQVDVSPRRMLNRHDAERFWIDY